ncbi:hypothetical protein HHSLTHF2_11200 [Vreelandella venusta]|uniref:Uncharacterized protein n=1 Tax=Halomonas hydrothermalis TaxID=115561 RepID=A0A6F8U2T8_9GAMM|nr:hypothetical protein HHSLTHF2_11200 [Halomonas hydrothermalis]
MTSDIFIVPILKDIEVAAELIKLNPFLTSIVLLQIHAKYVGFAALLCEIQANAGWLFSPAFTHPLRRGL